MVIAAPSSCRTKQSVWVVNVTASNAAGEVEMSFIGKDEFTVKIRICCQAIYS